jgi:hypothetical protein
MMGNMYVCILLVYLCPLDRVDVPLDCIQIVCSNPTTTVISKAVIKSKYLVDGYHWKNHVNKIINKCITRNILFCFYEAKDSGDVLNSTTTIVKKQNKN